MLVKLSQPHIFIYLFIFLADSFSIDFVETGTSVAYISLKPCVNCGGLNENGPRGLLCLNTWSLVGGNVWEGLGVLLKEVCHWGAGRLEVLEYPCHSPWVLCLLACGFRCELSIFPPPCLSPAIMDSNAPEL